MEIAVNKNAHLKSDKNSNAVLVSCFIAGMTEMYDFVIFGLLATLIHDKYLGFVGGGNSLLITYALFSVGFICRPLGAIIFGYIGDIYGRKSAIVISVTMMGFASLSMCLMPSYESIGIISCYLITLARIVQGLSVGGEMTGGVVFAIEHFDKKSSGLAGSVVIAGCLSGVFLATVVANIVKLPSSPEEAWRAAFLIGFIVSLVGFFIRQKLTETPDFQKIKKMTSKMPLVEGLRNNKIESITSILIGASCGTNIYFAVVFIPVYLKSITGIEMSYLSIISTVVMATMSPLFGWLSDKVSRSGLIIFGAIVSSIYALMMLPLIMSNQSVFNICLVIGLHAFIYSIQEGTICTFSAEIFPTKYRFSCAAFCQSIGIGIIGGSSPMISTLITKYFDDASFVLGLYVSGITLFAGVAVYFTSRKRKKIHSLNSINKNEIKKDFKLEDYETAEAT